MSRIDTSKKYIYQLKKMWFSDSFEEWPVPDLEEENGLGKSKNMTSRIIKLIVEID